MAKMKTIRNSEDILYSVDDFLEAEVGTVVVLKDSLHNTAFVKTTKASQCPTEWEKTGSRKWYSSLELSNMGAATIVYIFGTGK